MAAIVFVIDLVQDVNILRPLIQFARNLGGAEITVLTSTGFYAKDPGGLWANEIQELCAHLEVPIVTFTSEFEAFQFLQNRRGLLISSSESTVRNHATAHNLFSAAPTGFVTVVLQHGFECLGFLHNDAHDRAYGRHIGFAADIVCGWFGPAALTSLAQSERSKLYVSGPPLLLDPRPRTPRARTKRGREDARPGGLVCENLHSVRLAGGDLKSEFLDAFTTFSKEALDMGVEIWLRPHPAGRYTDVKKVQIPAGVSKSEGPIYREPFERYRFAISPPSSIVLDLVVEGIPVAVWRDSEGYIDCRNYDGLPTVSDADEWWNFVAQALLDPSPLLEAQETFLKRLDIPTDVPERFRALLGSFG